MSKNVYQLLIDLDALIEDPMWAHHAEVSKATLVLCKNYVEALHDICAECGENGEPEYHRSHRDYIKDARKLMNIEYVDSSAEPEPAEVFGALCNWKFVKDKDFPDRMHIEGELHRPDQPVQKIKTEDIVHVSYDHQENPVCVTTVGDRIYYLGDLHGL